MIRSLPRTFALASCLTALIILGGITLHFVWPQEPLALTVGIDPGFALVVIGLVIALGVLGPAYFWRRSQQADARAVEFRQNATIAEERVRSLERAHARFMRELDHQLKNPLQAIKSALEELEATNGPTESTQTARTQVERIRVLIGRLRRIATVTPHSLVLESVNLNDVVEEAVELATTSAPGCADRLRIVVPDTAGHPARVQADRELASHAVFNLVENALKYSPDSTVVEVRLRHELGTATIEVADDGIGIDAADLPHITEEFYRSNQTSWLDGSGLGLAVVQRVAAAHNGRLDLRSKPGEGTVATLRFPLASANSVRS